MGIKEKKIADRKRYNDNGLGGDLRYRAPLPFYDFEYLNYAISTTTVIINSQVLN